MQQLLNKLKKTLQALNYILYEINHRIEDGIKNDLHCQMYLSITHIMYSFLTVILIMPTVFHR